MTLLMSMVVACVGLYFGMIAASHAHPLPALEAVHVARLPELPGPRLAPEGVPGGDGADLLAQQLARHEPAHRLSGPLLALLSRLLGPAVSGSQHSVDKVGPVILVTGIS